VDDIRDKFDADDVPQVYTEGVDWLGSVVTSIPSNRHRERQGVEDDGTVLHRAQWSPLIGGKRRSTRQGRGQRSQLDREFEAKTGFSRN
jgi:hypothetical protein